MTNVKADSVVDERIERILNIAIVIERVSGLSGQGR